MSRHRSMRDCFEKRHPTDMPAPRKGRERPFISRLEDEVLNGLQQGLCAICTGSLLHEKRGYHIDHDRRKTGLVRGLLCGSCNRALGLMDDDPERLRRAADYLATLGGPRIRDTEAGRFEFKPDERNNLQPRRIPEDSEVPATSVDVEAGVR